MPPTNPDAIRVRQLLEQGVRGVVAPQSGGCARHVFSQRVDCRRDDHGRPLFVLDGSNASSLRLLVDSTVTLIIECPDGDGEEYQLTGHLAPSGEGAWFLNVIRAYHVLPSGEKQPIPAIAGG